MDETLPRLIYLDICSTAKVLMSSRYQNPRLAASARSAIAELTGLQTAIGAEVGGGVWECPAVHRWLSVGSPSRLWGPCAPLLFHRPSLKCLGDDREIVGVCQRMTSTCQESACSGRRLLEKETRKDGWIRHSHLSVNIHDVIFSLKGRLCLRASTIAATVVSVWRGITGFFFVCFGLLFWSHEKITMLRTCLS